jgi:hypothetical protein
MAGLLMSGKLAAAPAAIAPPDEKKENGPTFAFVCLQETTPPQPAALKASLAAWLKVPASTVGEPESTTDANRRVTSIKIGEHTLMIGLMDRPIPKPDIEYACANSFLWPNAAAELANHPAHLIVIATGKFATPAAQALWLSRAICATSETYKAAGIYWGHASTVHEPKRFREFIRGASTEMEKLPIPAWIGFLRARNDAGGVDVYTDGLDVFGVMECEVINTKQPPGEVIGLLSGLSAYLITKGNVIADGNTVGGSEEEKIVARHSESAIGREGKVLRIEY